MTILVCGLGLSVFAGCQKTWRGSAVQPNPIANPNDTLRQSEEIVIVTGDMDLNAPRPATVFLRNNHVECVNVVKCGHRKVH